VVGKVLKFVELVAAGLWLGTTAGLWIAVYTLRAAQPAAVAAGALELLLARYYVGGVVCGLVLAGVAAARGTLWGWTGMQPMAAVLFGLLTALALFGRFVLAPGWTTVSAGVTCVVFLLLLVYAYWMSVRGY
jgi:hypothetical protein